MPDPDVWLFGTFQCANKLNSQDTKDYRLAKWRSETIVPVGSLIQSTNNIMRAEFQSSFVCYLIYLTDLEYQLRDTSPKPTDRRLVKTNNATRRVSSNYLWFKDGTLETYQVPFNPNPVNPNDPNNPNPNNPNPFDKPTPTPKPLIDLGYLNFAEERLELGYDYGAVGGVAFETEIVEVAGGNEQRNALRALPLGRWQLGERSLLESDLEGINEVEYLKAFHAARVGSFEGFRFKDWSDYQAVDQLIGVGDNFKTQFQLRKAYQVGSAIFYRPIIKPVEGTVNLDFPNYQLNYDIDHTKGLVTFDNPPAPGTEIRASFEFDIPVWFESDQISFKLQGYEEESKQAIYQLESVFVVEGRIPIPEWIDKPIQQIDLPLNLGIIYETIEEHKFATTKQELKSGYVKRESKMLESQLSFNLGSRNYDSAEVERILSYFWLSKGRLKPFPFVNLDKIYTVRFDQDQLSLKFEASSAKEGIEGEIVGREFLYSLPGLKLKIV